MNENKQDDLLEYSQAVRVAAYEDVITELKAAHKVLPLTDIAHALHKSFSEDEVEALVNALIVKA